MSLKLKRREHAGPGLQRIIAQRLQNAISELQKVGPQADEAIHNARKRLKESRAVLRLLRPALPGKVYRFEKTVYRDAARPLSHVRDTRVLLDALEILARGAGQDALDVSEIRLDLEARRTHLHHELASDGLIDRISLTLQQAHDRIGSWPVEGGQWSTLRCGILPAYRRGRRLMRELADARPDSAVHHRLHDWRKQAKTLWYQMQVLEATWPATMQPLAQQIHQLTDLLGEDHDLVILRGLIDSHGSPEPSSAENARLRDRIDARRLELQQGAFRIGEYVYAERPQAFVRRLGQYWRTWKTTNPPKKPPVPSENGVSVEAVLSIAR